MELLKSIMLFLEFAVRRFFKLLDDTMFMRRAMFIIVFLLGIDAYQWAKGFAVASKLSGAELGLVIAAVTGPLTALMGYVFRVYGEQRGL